MTIDELRLESPFPWRQEINFDGMGRVRMVDAKGVEVPLFSMTGLAVYASQTFNTPQAAPTPPQPTTEVPA